MFYEKVKTLADEKGKSIAQLERESGLANGTIGKWQTVNPRIDNLQAVATALEVPITELLGVEGSDGRETILGRDGTSTANANRGDQETESHAVI